MFIVVKSVTLFSVILLGPVQKHTGCKDALFLLQVQFDFIWHLVDRLFVKWSSVN